MWEVQVEQWKVQSEWLEVCLILVIIWISVLNMAEGKKVHWQIHPLNIDAVLSVAILIQDEALVLSDHTVC